MSYEPIPNGCFREEPEVTYLKQFHILLEIVSLEDNRGQFLVVDIDFHKIRQIRKPDERSLPSDTCKKGAA